MNFLEQVGESNGFIKGLSEKVGLKPGFVTLIIMGIAFIFLYHGVTSGFLFFLLGILIPWYDTFRAIEDPQKDNDTKMLKYWITFSLILLMDGFLQPSVSFTFFAGILRLLIILFLTFNDYKGSKMTYNYLIGPFMRAYRDDIAATYKNIKKSLSELKESIKQGVSSEPDKEKDLMNTKDDEQPTTTRDETVDKDKKD